jgi:hypothetical protein
MWLDIPWGSERIRVIFEREIISLILYRAHVSGHLGKAVTRGRINAIFGTDAAGYS